MPDKVMLIVIDQLRADCLSGALADAAPLPNLLSLMAEATSFQQHYTVTTPCGPSRASLLTGLYAMNHRSIRNGTPLSSQHLTIGTSMRSVGYEPMLFGYTDVSADPTGLHPNDPDLKNYEGLAPGFAEMLRLRLETPGAWVGYLKRRGYTLPTDYWDLFKPTLDPATASEEDPAGSPIRSPALYRAEDSDTAFLTDRTLETLCACETQPWFALITYIRPHPPLVAPAPYNTLFAPESLPSPQRTHSLAQLQSSHPFFSAFFSEPSHTGLYRGFDGHLDTLAERHVDELRAVYLGLAREVDTHIGRLLDYLRDSGQYDDTLIVVTADHGDMLGDQYLWGKSVPFDAAVKVPLIIRDPHQPQSFGKQIDAFTESVDLAPTLLDWTGADHPGSFDGRSLLPWVQGRTPSQWRDYVFSETELGEPDEVTLFQKAWQLPARQSRYALLRTRTHKLVHFNGGIPPLLYDLEADALETHNLATDPAYADVLHRLTSAMLDHRMSHANGALSECKLTDQGVFRVSAQ
ncbi:MAG: sulfatase-like hydrolase/transferase [Granulosicoccus sp.]|nr:sulfatase-like hydrolase/transferase [Granulosicoccus sp.]